MAWSEGHHQEHEGSWRGRSRRALSSWEGSDDGSDESRRRLFLGIHLGNNNSSNGRHLSSWDNGSSGSGSSDRRIRRLSSSGSDSGSSSGSSRRRLNSAFDKRSLASAPGRLETTYEIREHEWE